MANSDSKNTNESNYNKQHNNYPFFFGNQNNNHNLSVNNQNHNNPNINSILNVSQKYV